MAGKKKASKKPAIYCPYDGAQRPPDQPGRCPLDRVELIHPCIAPSGRSAPGGILIVGEAPGREEDAQGEGFVGRSGQLLRSTLAEADVSLSLVTFTNVVRCRPPENAKPPAKAITCCVREHLRPLIADLAPTLIVAAGATALKALVGGKSASITALQGCEVEHDDDTLPPIVAAWHPAFVLRNEYRYRQDLVAALREAKALYDRIVANAPPEGPPQELDVWWPAVRGDFAEALGRLRALYDSMAPGSAVAYDCETTGLDPWRQGAEPRILSLSVSPSPFKAIVIPMDHPGGPVWTPAERQALQDALRRILQRPDVIKVAHNAKFDNKWLLVCWGWEPTAGKTIGEWPGLFDTMLAHSLTAPGEAHGLDALVRRRARSWYGEYWREVHNHARRAATARRRQVKRRKSKDEEIAEAEGRYDFSLVPLPLLAPYNGRDTMATMRIFELLQQDLRATNTLRVFRELVMPASATLQRMEVNGLAVHRDNLVELTGEYILRETRARTALRQLPTVAAFEQHRDATMNWGSSQQKALLLYGMAGKVKGQTPPAAPWTYGLTPPHLTAGGAGSTDKEAVKELLADPDLPDEARRCLTLMRELSEAQKILGTYLRPLPAWAGRDGLVHTVFKIHGARSGRLSSARPNLQNQPKDTRKIFTSRFRDGLLLWADYSQLEARVIACFCKDPEFLRVFLEGKDFHIMNAAAMTGLDPGGGTKDDPGEITPELRQRAKGAVSFGLMYGRSAEALAQDLQIPLPEAQRMRDMYFRRVPGLMRWINSVVEYARAHDGVGTAFGRWREIPDIKADDPQRRAHAERQAVNSPVQSTASDMTLSALIRLDAELLRGGFRAVPVVTVHDSIVVDCPREEAQAVGVLMVRIMQDVSMYPWAIVPFPVELGAGRCWTG